MLKFFKHPMASIIVMSGVFSIILLDKNILASAQEHQGCFTIDHAQRVVNLDGLCNPQKAKGEEEKPQIVKGIALSNVFLQAQQSSQPLMIGKITNTTNQTLQMSSITLQLEDKITGDVVTTQTPNVTATLAPGQSREFRELVGKDVDLGGRSAFQMTVIFVDWK